MINYFKPHLPEKKCELFIVDKKIKSLKLDNTVQSYEHNNILSGINTHPDMTICPLYNEDIIVCKEAYNYYAKLLAPFGFNIIKGENDIKSEYPYDIALNCVILAGKLFHKIKYTDKALLKYCKEKGIELVNVSQGYTKCSTLIIDENSVITCDKKLNDIYNKYGIDSLFVKNEDIGINNFEHGFIGGTGGKLSQDEIGFYGNIEAYSDFDKIKDFLAVRNIKYRILMNGPLFDYGSLISLHIFG